jgi:hypothetical protein
MTSLLSAPSGVLLGQRRPRIRAVPPAVDTAGPEACLQLRRETKQTPDPWQEDAVADILAEAANGRWAARRTYTIVARQNGKGGIIEPVELYGLYQLHETILHSAHLFDTAREAFMRIRSLIDGSADLSRRVKRINEAHGKEGIELLDRPSKFAGDGTLLNRGGPGGQLRFHARTKGGGRGKSPQRLILDEGFALTREQMAALLPAISAQEDPQVNVFSTPPPIGQPCEVLMAARAQVLAWLEWGVERGTDVTQPEAWAAANPAYGIRIFEQGCRDELDALGLDEFSVERCGIWPATGTARWLVIPEAVWMAFADVPDAPVPPMAFGLEVEWDRSAAALGVAWRRADGLRQIELTQDDSGVDHRPGTGWCVDRAKQLLKRWPGSTLTLDPGGPAGSLVPHLEDERVPFQKMTLQDAAKAYGDFWDGLVGKDESARNIRHGNQVALNAAIAGAVERSVGDARAWDRQNSSGFAPAGAVTAALFGLRRALVPRSKIY